MRTIVTYETQHGSAKKLAEFIAKGCNATCINVDTPFMAEDETSFDTYICVFGFRGPYTAQLTKLFLSRMSGKLTNKNLIVVGEGIFSDKEFPSVADGLSKLCPTNTFNKYFMRGQLRVNTLTFEEQHLLKKFSELTGMKIVDMGEFDEKVANDLANTIAKQVSELPIVEEVKQDRWVCTVCGYVHTGSEPPEKCPMCQQPKEVFKKM